MYQFALTLLVPMLITLCYICRLGAGANGIEDIKNHEFFANIEWEALCKKEVCRYLMLLKMVHTHLSKMLNQIELNQFWLPFNGVFFDVQLKIFSCFVAYKSTTEI